jgi:hypothetical protein
MTVVIDSYFWNQWPLWPEFASLFFNVVEGKSAEWGVSPPHTYFTSYLPKLLLGALPLSVLGTFIDARVRSFILPSLAFIALLSSIGHKEWRFVAYVVPLFNIAAARGARALYVSPRSPLLRFLIVSLRQRDDAQGYPPRPLGVPGRRRPARAKRHLRGACDVQLDAELSRRRSDCAVQRALRLRARRYAACSFTAFPARAC